MTVLLRACVTFKRAPHPPVCDTRPSVLRVFQSRPPPDLELNLAPTVPSLITTFCAAPRGYNGRCCVTTDAAAPHRRWQTTQVSVCARSSRRDWPEWPNRPDVVTNNRVMWHLWFPLHLFQHVLHICWQRHERQLHPPPPSTLAKLSQCKLKWPCCYDQHPACRP